MNGTAHSFCGLLFPALIFQPGRHAQPAPDVKPQARTGDVGLGGGAAYRPRTDGLFTASASIRRSQPFCKIHISTSRRIRIPAGITSDLQELLRSLPTELFGPPGQRGGPRGTSSSQSHDHVRVIDIPAEFAAAIREAPGRMS